MANKNIKSKIVKTFYKGKIKLELAEYPTGRKAFVLSFRGNKEIIHIDYKQLRKYIDDFDEIINVKNNLM